MSDMPPRPHRRAKRIDPEMRRVIQESGLSVRTLARKLAIDPKTVRRWQNRTSTQAARSGPRIGYRHIFTGILELAATAIRRHLRLPIDDCLYVLQQFQPSLSRATLHRRLRDHGLSRLPTGSKQVPHKGWFNVALYEVGNGASPRSLLIAVEPDSRYLFARIYDQPVSDVAEAFLRDLVTEAPAMVSGITVERGSSVTCHRRAVEASCRALSIGYRQLLSFWPADGGQDTLDAVIRQAAEQLHGLPLSEFRENLAAGVDLYNTGCRLKVLAGKTPMGRLEHNSDDALPSHGLPAVAPPIHLPHPARGAKGSAYATREHILDCARTLLANGGPEGLTMSRIARGTGLSRGTIYQHFGSRTELAADAARWSSRQLITAVFGPDLPPGEKEYESADVPRVMTRLADFAISNPVMGQAWLFQVLSSPKPSEDEFWREYFSRSEQFHETPMAAKDIDTEVLSVILLAGTFLWAQWARSRFDKEEDLNAAARRFVKEFMRLALHGTLNTDNFSETQDRVLASN